MTLQRNSIGWLSTCEDIVDVSPFEEASPTHRSQEKTSKAEMVWDHNRCVILSNVGVFQP